MEQELIMFIKNALYEDVREGDHSALACIPENAQGKAKLLVKDNGIIAGVEVAKKICEVFDPNMKITSFSKDGDFVKKGDIALEIEGSARSILTTERLILNCMQRMSGIATQTNQIVDLMKGTKAKLLDTRKTTPGIRFIEKWAVRIGGGQNHRFGLYDMIMIKDNHIDFAGGIKQALGAVKEYQTKKKLNLKVEIEVRNEKELKEALSCGGFDRIMLDNFSPSEIRKALLLIPEKYETEASGGISIDSIKDYAETGIKFISVGALTHSVKNFDLSLKSEFSFNQMNPLK
ncbi:MAG: carboxylating nicotinate-nucleotide diphosphorylase [Bacteroidetes bacterium]|nr:carboxylating nicotinate-nucleotide diphosphorylase [Bacteroidota bacterium]